MAPVRTAKSTGNTKQKHRNFNEFEEGSSAAPGVQKIKASLRQTRRFLAKDNLAADVRVESERKLKALEADLAEAQVNRKAKAFAKKYHMVKFFEKKKVIRKIKQLKKSISDEEKLEDFEQKLTELRVDLNYILHYPKDKRYISLFPPEVRAGEPPAANDDDEKEDQDNTTDAQRDELRQWIREQMEKGEISREPELGHLLNVQSKPSVYSDPRTKAREKRKRGKEDEPVQKEAEDAFFARDSEDEDDDEEMASDV